MGLCTAPKIRIFLWKLYNNIFSTRKNLSKRSLSIQSCCPICSEHMKDAVHVLFQCQVDAKMRLSSPFWWVFFHGPVIYILERMLEWSTYDSARFAYILWGIQNSRTNMLFQQIPPIPSKIILQAFRLWGEYLRMHHQLDDISSLLMLPRLGFGQCHPSK